MENKNRIFYYKDRDVNEDFYEKTLVIRDDENGIGWDLGVFFPSEAEIQMGLNMGVDAYRIYRNMFEEDFPKTYGMETMCGKYITFIVKENGRRYATDVGSKEEMIKDVLNINDDDKLVELIESRLERPQDIDLACLVDLKLDDRHAYMTPCMLEHISILWETEEDMMTNLIDVVDRFPNGELCGRCRNLINCIKSKRYGHEDFWAIDEDGHPYRKTWDEILNRNK